MYNKGAKDKTLNPLKEATAIHLCFYEMQL